MRAALRHLAEQGIAALQPQQITTKAIVHANQYVSKPAKTVWRRPIVSKRVGNDLRKQAIQAGTYGSFDPTTGQGWDSTWDLALFSQRYKATQRFTGIRPSKTTSRVRSREARAQAIEAQLEQRDQVLDEYYSAKEEARVKDPSFEAYFKRFKPK